MGKKNEKAKSNKKETEETITPSNMQSRITSEYNKLTKLFNITAIEKDHKDHVIKKLLKRASFLLVLSEQMEQTIRDSELTIETINASQQFTKSNPLLKDYRDTVKSYQAVIKQLCDLVKDEPLGDKEKRDELEEFLNS